MDPQEARGRAAPAPDAPASSASAPASTATTAMPAAGAADRGASQDTPDQGASQDGPDQGASQDAAPQGAADPDAAEAEARGPTPEDVAAQEQEELLRQARRRAWHERRWLRALLVIGALAGVAALVPYPLRITAECALLPGQRVRARAEIAGVIAEVLADEGQRVKRGDVIARLDDRALRAERQKAAAEIEKLEAELAILRKGRRPEEIQQQAAILAARTKEVEFAAREAERREGMAREGVGSVQAADQAARELEARRRAVAEAEAALRLLRAGSRPEEIAAQEAVLRRARAELAYVDERLAMTEVRAPIDGEILTPRFRERVHEGIEAGGLVCEIASTRVMRAEIFVPERDLDAIDLGMPAIVKVESYPTHPFAGKVDFIAPAIDGEHRHLRVAVDLDNEAGLLKANMTGYGEIEAGERSLLHLATRRVLRWIRVRFLL